MAWLKGNEDEYKRPAPPKVKPTANGHSGDVTVNTRYQPASQKQPQSYGGVFFWELRSQGTLCRSGCPSAHSGNERSPRSHLVEEGTSRAPAR
jgi:hypothetical protein